MTSDVPASAASVVRAEGPAARHGAISLQAWLFRANQDARPVDIDGLSRLVEADENFVWIDLSEFSASDLERLAQLLRIDRRAVRAAISPWQRPRVDVYGDHFFTSATVARIDPGRYRVAASELDVVVGRNYLLSLHKQPLPFGEALLARARHSPELVRLDSAFMLYIVLDELLEHYESMVETLEDEIEALEERALRDTSDAFLEDLFHLKRFVFALGRVADQHEEVFAAFLRPDFSYVSGEDVEPYFRDLDNRLERLLDRIDGAREAVHGAFDIYVSHVSHRTNQVMRILTMVSTILLPATII
ncbi:MAG: magnesium transporter CorA family protein, partial [Thermomicrobiaceae bacterium]|nr:magnesium transporter CorA family protein [Thermomicrobiaceae bacterium]